MSRIRRLGGVAALLSLAVSNHSVACPGQGRVYSTHYYRPAAAAAPATAVQTQSAFNTTAFATPIQAAALAAFPIEETVILETDEVVELPVSFALEQPGKVILRDGQEDQFLEIVEWNPDFVAFHVPARGLRRPLDATLYVVRPDGVKVAEMPVVLVNASLKPKRRVITAPQPQETRTPEFAPGAQR